MLFTLLIVVIALIALVLTLVILLQSGKGGGLAGIAAGGTTQILGSRQAPDILEKATWMLGTMFIVLCILTNFTIDTAETSESVIQQQVQGAPVQEQQAPVLPQTPPADASSAGEGATGNEDGGN